MDHRDLLVQIGLTRALRSYYRFNKFLVLLQEGVHWEFQNNLIYLCTVFVFLTGLQYSSFKKNDNLSIKKPLAL